MTKNDLKRIYNKIDDYFKSINNVVLELKRTVSWDGSRGPKRRLSISEVVALNIIRFLMRINDLKIFYKYAKDNLTDKFVNLPNYGNFMKATHKSLPFITLFMNSLLRYNRSANSNVHFVDSTPISVCLNHHIYTHKVAKDIAQQKKIYKRLVLWI